MSFLNYFESNAVEVEAPDTHEGPVFRIQAGASDELTLPLDDYWSIESAFRRNEDKLGVKYEKISFFTANDSRTYSDGNPVQGSDTIREDTLYQAYIALDSKA